VARPKSRQKHELTDFLGPSIASDDFFSLSGRRSCVNLNAQTPLEIP
jgi:hypothetical protein